MMGYKQFTLTGIEEAFKVKEGKNVHLEHIEDEVLNGGISGIKQALTFLQALRDMLAGYNKEHRVNVTTKFDGAPAIIAGINPENHKFFVGTKGVFAGNAKLNYTPEDIDKNHPAEGLNKKLKIALQYLPEIGIKDIIQGDLMFTQDDLKTEVLEGEKSIIFTPNTITYAVPEDSTLANQIKTAKMGIVWHTSYTGKTIKDLKANFNVNIGKLTQTKNVWFRNATFIDDSGSATFTLDETAQITQTLSQIGRLFNQISARVANQIATNETYRNQIKIYNNSKVKEGQKITDTYTHLKGLVHNLELNLNKNIITAKKTDTRRKREQEKNIILSFYRTNFAQIKMLFDMQNLIVDAKHMIINKLRTVKGLGTFIKTADGFKVTHPEGFVAVSNDGKAVKLIDRLHFSHLNFTIQKNW
jgi:hypothetical protein